MPFTTTAFSTPESILNVSLTSLQVKTLKLFIRVLYQRFVCVVKTVSPIAFPSIVDVKNMTLNSVTDSQWSARCASFWWRIFQFQNIQKMKTSHQRQWKRYNYTETNQTSKKKTKINHQYFYTKLNVLFCSKMFSQRLLFLLLLKGTRLMVYFSFRLCMYTYVK